MGKLEMRQGMQGPTHVYEGKWMCMLGRHACRHSRANSDTAVHAVIHVKLQKLAHDYPLAFTLRTALRWGQLRKCKMAVGLTVLDSHAWASGKIDTGHRNNNRPRYTSCPLRPKTFRHFTALPSASASSLPEREQVIPDDWAK